MREVGRGRGRQGGRKACAQGAREREGESVRRASEHISRVPPLSHLRTKATKEREEHKAAGGGCASLDEIRLDLISIMLIESKSSLYCFSGQDRAYRIR